MYNTFDIILNKFKIDNEVLIMKINYIKIMFSILIVFVFTMLLISCDSTQSFGGTLTITARRLEIEVYAEFDADDRLASSKPYIELYSVDEDDDTTTYEEREELSFSDDDYTQTDSVTFDGLDEDTPYVLKLYVTYDKESYEICVVNTATSPQGSSEENPILVSTYDELLDMANDNEAYYKLSNDIDCEGNTIDSIFNGSNIFKGGFDGDNYTVSNFVLPSNTYLGLIGYAENATIKNLNLDTVSLTSSLASSGRGETYGGALIGKGINTTIENVNVKNVDFDISFSISASAALGGFGGKLENCTVSNCSLENASLNIIKAQKQVVTGLFIGRIDKGTVVTNSHSTGDITSVTYFKSSTDVYNFVGGFIGVSSANIGEVSDCYTIVDITVTENSNQSSLISGHKLAVGGFVGSNFQTTFSINNCAAIADITVTTTYSGNSHIGGLAGNVDMSGCSFTNSIYIPKENGIKVNVVEDSAEETTDETTEDSEEETTISTDANIYISLVFGTNTEFITSNIYVSSELLTYGETTYTNIISDNYVLYDETLYKDNLSETIQNAIESYINK